MDNSVRSRPVHYETLGLTPEATHDEIRQSFAKKMSECRWDLTDAPAQICIAYETLGNRFKRVDYDRSHGLEPKPQPRLSTMTVTQQRWVPFIASVPTNALGQAAQEASAKSRLTSPHDPEALAASKPRALVAASLDELANRAGSRESEERLHSWKRPALALGGLVLAAGLIGGFAGLSLKDDEGSTPSEPPAAVAAPAHKPQPKAAAPLTHPLATETEVNEPAVRFVATEPRTRPIYSQRRTHWRVRHRAVKSRTTGSEPANGQLNTNQAVSEAPVSQPVAADVPH
ncbi:MAG TPA: hypothetical protein VM711_07645 [Sphingomicrobium sp.]|nr:hypothetical protein [Sphingomicrobium sp.]